MYRFIFSRRWLIRILAGLLLVALCVRLGIWQLDRNTERSAGNTIIEANATESPSPLRTIAQPRASLDPEDEWKLVSITGRYDPSHQLALRLRPLNGEPGVHVLTPFITAQGEAILIDRGFLAVAPGTPNPELPAAPAEDVTLTARLRPSEEGKGTGGDPSSGVIRYVNTAIVEQSLPYEVYRPWGELVTSTPEPDPALQLVPPPQPDAGPHLSYAIQWFLFAIVGVGGFVFLLRAESKGRREVLNATEDPPAPEL